MSEPVVVKLISGEIFMANVLGDTPESLIVQDPVAVRAIHVSTPDGVIERTVTNPFCSITDEREFSFDKSHILFIKRLHPRVVKYYNQLLETLSEEDVLPDYVDEPDEEKSEEPESIIVIPDKHQIH